MLRIGLIVKDEVSWSSRALKPLHNEVKIFCAKLTPARVNPDEGKDKNLCDECNVQLTAIRLKCTVCDDFDLCSACDKKDVHDHHVMMRFAGAVQNVIAWKDTQGSSSLHAKLTAFHDHIISVKGTPRVGSVDRDASNASVKSAKETRSTKAPSKTPSRSRRSQGRKRAAALTAGTPKSARTSTSQASGPCAVTKSSPSAGSVASGPNSTRPSRGVRGNDASAFGELQQTIKSEEPAESLIQANQAAAAGSPLIGPLKAENTE
ncbi:Sequestosome-1, partial [Aphelenchoides avenae]